MVQNWIKLGVMSLVAAMMFQCSEVPINRYFTLATSPKTSIEDGVKCRLPLVVSVSALPAYKHEKLMFRTSDVEIRYYNYRYWVNPPEMMLTGLLSQRFVRSKLFDMVFSRINSPDRFLALYVTLEGLEELDRGDAWYARVSMRFVLKTQDARENLWRYAFDKEKKAKERRVLSVVRTMNRIYDDEMGKMTASLRRFVDDYPDCQ